MPRIFPGETAEPQPVYSLVVVHATGQVVRLGPWYSLTTARSMRTRYLGRGVGGPFLEEEPPARTAYIDKADNWKEVE